MEPENGTARGDSFWIANTIILGPMLNFGSVPFIKFITCIYNIYTYTWYTLYIYICYIHILHHHSHFQTVWQTSSFWGFPFLEGDYIPDLANLRCRWGCKRSYCGVPETLLFTMVHGGTAWNERYWCHMMSFSSKDFFVFFWRRKQQPAVLLTSPFDQSCHGPVTVAPGPSRVREPQFWNPPLFSRLKGSL